MTTGYPDKALDTGAKIVKAVTKMDTAIEYWSTPLPEKNGVLKFEKDPSRQRRIGRDAIFASTTKEEVFQLRVLRNIAQELWPPNSHLENDENDFRSNPEHPFFDRHDAIGKYNTIERKKVESQDLDPNSYTNACGKIQVTNSIAVNIKIGQIYFEMMKVFMQLMEESREQNKTLFGFYYPDDPYNLCCLFLVKKLKKLAENTKTTSGSAEIQKLRDELKNILKFVEKVSAKNVFWRGAPRIRIVPAVSAASLLKENIKVIDFNEIEIQEDEDEREFKLGDYLHLFPAELKFLDELLIWGQQHISLLKELTGLQNVYQSLSITFDVHLNQLYMGSGNRPEPGLVQEKMIPILPPPSNKEMFFRYFDGPFLEDEFDSLALLGVGTGTPASLAIMPRTIITRGECIEKLQRSAPKNTYILRGTRDFKNSGFANFLKDFYLDPGLDEEGKINVRNEYFKPQKITMLVNFFNLIWSSRMKTIFKDLGEDIGNFATLHCWMIGYQHSLMALNNMWAKIHEILNAIGEIGLFKCLREVADFAKAYLQTIESYKQNIVSLENTYMSIIGSTPSDYLEESSLLSYQKLTLTNLRDQLNELEERARCVSRNCVVNLSELDRRITHVMEMIHDVQVEMPDLLEEIASICGQKSLANTSTTPKSAQVPAPSGIVEKPKVKNNFIFEAAAFIPTLKSVTDAEKIQLCYSFLVDYHEGINKSKREKNIDRFFDACNDTYPNPDPTSPHWLGILKKMITEFYREKSASRGLLGWLSTATPTSSSSASSRLPLTPRP